MMSNKSIKSKKGEAEQVSQFKPWGYTYDRVDILIRTCSYYFIKLEETNDLTTLKKVFAILNELWKTPMVITKKEDRQIFENDLKEIKEDIRILREDARIMQIKYPYEPRYWINEASLESIKDKLDFFSKKLINLLCEKGMLLSIMTKIPKSLKLSRGFDLPETPSDEYEVDL